MGHRVRSSLPQLRVLCTSLIGFTSCLHPEATQTQLLNAEPLATCRIEIVTSKPSQQEIYSETFPLKGDACHPLSRTFLLLVGSDSWQWSATWNIFFNIENAVAALSSPPLMHYVQNVFNEITICELWNGFNNVVLKSIDAFGHSKDNLDIIV